MRALLRSIGLGRLAYRLYYQPVGAAQACIREGGPIEQYRTRAGRAAMAEAARALVAPESTGGSPRELHVLTGKRFWDQTAFCLWTFSRQCGRTIAPTIYDDGSLEQEHAALLARLFPSARLVTREEIAARLDRHLPASRYPVLRERWAHYPNIRKLTDPHAGASGWKLVVDSDLLFFRRPEFLLRWLDAPARPLHAVDAESSYGYSAPLMSSLAGAPLREKVNVGLCGLRSEELDWDRLEHWCATLIERAGAHYYLEQALVAMLVAGRDCAVAPQQDYVTLPTPPEALECRAVMHHYVAQSKRWYFQHNWRKALGAAAAG